MARTATWAGIGWACGMLLLAGFGFWSGFTQGEPSSRLPPGPNAALTSAFVFVAYFWWVAGPIGAIFGGATGCGSWLVRPRKRREPD